MEDGGWRDSKIWSQRAKMLGYCSAERRSRKRSGVRPSSGAATPERRRASYLSAAIRASCDAAPGDGRTPVQAQKSSRLGGDVGILRIAVRMNANGAGPGEGLFRCPPGSLFQPFSTKMA